MPWKRRPRGRRLLAALADPDRGFDAVVIGEPQRAFYGNQFGLTFPLFTHYGVQLWVPEVGGPIDPDYRGPRPDHVGLRRHVQGRAEPDQDPGPRRDGRPGRRSRAASSAADRPTATGSSTPGRTPTRPRPPTASACTRWSPTRSAAPVVRADLRRVPRRPRPLRHRRATDRRRHPVPVRRTTRPATRTAAASPGPRAPSAPS